MTPIRYFSQQPGDGWEDGLALGDGTTGALLWGTPRRHVATIAHESVVLPTDPIRSAPDLARDLPTFRSLITTGQAQDAADLAVRRSREQGYPGLQWTDPLVPVAALVIDSATAEYSNYRREVEIGGQVRISWNDRHGAKVITAFVSRSDHLLLLQLTGFGPAAASVRLVPPASATTSRSGVRGGNEHHVDFQQSPGGVGSPLQMSFTANWVFRPAGATTYLTVLAEDAATSTVAVETVVRWTSGQEPAPPLNAAAGSTYLDLYRRHRSAHADQVHTVQLDLNTPASGLPTESLLGSGDPRLQREIMQLQFATTQALIADSTGRLPPTLQGVWSGTFDPAWSSDYTMNGNMQNGSLAAMLPTGNPAQLLSYLDMLERFSDDFAENARLLFGTGGFVLPSRCSPSHGRTTHFDEQHCHEFWTAGGAWAAAFFLDFCWYTADLDYLRTHAYPFARAVEDFYQGFLLVDQAGVVTFNPSYSPENRSVTFASQACRNATMDRAALAGLLRCLQRAAELLGIDDHLAPRRQAWLTGLPDYRVAPDGTLAEWLDDGVVENVEHRTASQLWGLWFEPDQDIVHDERLRAAVRAVIDAKLAWRASADGVEEMAYGLVQLGIAAAAVGHAAGAMECLTRLSALYFRPALTTNHDVGAIFNVDIAGGFPALVCAMLLQSTVTELHVLPALPTQWPTGSVRGIHARGALVIDLTWSPEEITLIVTALPGGHRLRRGAPVAIRLPANFTATSGALALADGATATVVAQRR